MLVLRLIQELLTKADSNSVRVALTEAQDHMDRLGAVHMVYVQLCQPRPNFDDVVVEQVRPHPDPAHLH